MVRSYLIGPLFGALALTGLAQGQTTAPAVPAKVSDSKERFVILGDVGKPGQKCRVLKTWTMPNGNPAYQVQALETGEVMTVEELASADSPTPAGVNRPKAMRIFHWGRDTQTSPYGSPAPPSNAIILAQPINIHPTTSAPPLATAPEKASREWPSAFAAKKPGDDVVVVPEKPLAPVAPSVANKAELAPLQPKPEVAKVMQPIAPSAAKTADLTTAQPAPVAANKSPYNVAHEDAPAVKTAEPKSWLWGTKPPEKKSVAADAPTPEPKQPAATAKPPEGKGVPPVGSPYFQTEAKPAGSNFWNSASTWKSPIPTPAAPVKPSETSTVKAPAPAGTPTTAKVEVTPAQAGDWRESWGKIPSPKPAPIRTEERPATATLPKVELPYAVVKADDPLSSPEKYAAIPSAGAFGDAPTKKEAKKPLVGLFAANPAPVASGSEEKKPERVTVTLPPPPIMVPAAATAPAPPAPPAPVVIPSPASVTLPPPGPVTLPPPGPVTLPPPGPAQLITPTAVKAPRAPLVPPSQAKGENKPTVPLGMQSALAAQSPELAPPIPKKPATASESQAMGIDVSEANAFTEGAPKEKASGSFNRFWVPKKPAAPTNPQPNAVAARIPSPPPVTQAAYRQEIAPELTQLSAVLRESVYPSQREWAAERLASLDWRRQPLVIELLQEREEQDPAPAVRAICTQLLSRIQGEGNHE